MVTRLKLSVMAILFCLACGGVSLTYILPAYANITFTLSATPVDVNQVGAFSLDFDDSNNNGILDLNGLYDQARLYSFSGVQLLANQGGWPSNRFFRMFDGWAYGFPGGEWYFSNPVQPPDPGFAPMSEWTYTQSPANGPPPVPLPASAFLLGSSLLGLVGWRRFRKG